MSFPRKTIVASLIFVASSAFALRSTSVIIPLFQSEWDGATHGMRVYCTVYNEQSIEQSLTIRWADPGLPDSDSPKVSNATAGNARTGITLAKDDSYTINFRSAYPSDYGSIDIIPSRITFEVDDTNGGNTGYVRGSCQFNWGSSTGKSKMGAIALNGGRAF